MEAELHDAYLALLLAKFQNMQELCIEGDEKNNLDSLVRRKDILNWSLTLLIDLVLALVSNFLFVSL